MMDGTCSTQARDTTQKKSLARPMFRLEENITRQAMYV